MHEVDIPSYVSNPDKWLVLGEGSYNKAFLSRDKLSILGFDGFWVYKQAKSNTSSLSSIDRSIRKWQLLNPRFPVIRMPAGWLVPYLGRQQATDTQIVGKILEIYREHRILIEDAPSRKNCLDYQGQVVFVDVDHAFRRNSISSDDYRAQQGYWHSAHNYLNNSKKFYPATASVIEALLYLETQLPIEQIQDDYLQPNILQTLLVLKDAGIKLHAWMLDTILALNQLPWKKAIPAHIYTEKLLRAIHNLARISPEKQEQVLDLMHEQLCRFEVRSMLSSAKELQQAQFLLQHKLKLLERVASSGYALQHIAVLHNNLALLKVLQESKPDWALPTGQSQDGSFIEFPMLTAMDIALHLPYPELKAYLGSIGAAISDKLLCVLGIKADALNHSNVESKLLELQQELKSLAKSHNQLTVSRSNTFCNQILIDQPHFLLMALDERGNNFLEYLFQFKNRILLNHLSRQPFWEKLSNSKNINTGWSLWHCIALYELDNLIPFIHKGLSRINDASSNSGSTPLHIAAGKKAYVVCMALLRLGANPNLLNKEGYLPESWYGQAEKNPFIVLSAELLIFVRDPDSLTIEKKEELLRLLLNNTHLLSWSLDKIGHNVLLLAFYYKNEWLLEKLRSLPNWQDLLATRNAMDSNSLLHYLAVRGTVNLLPFPWSTHFGLNSKNFQGKVPLMLAAQDGNIDFCKALLSQGALTDFQDNWDRTALMIASANSQAEICYMLLYSGANPGLLDNKGRNARVLWAGDPSLNPIILFRQELLKWTENTQDFDREKSQQLLQLVGKYRHLLSWRLNDSGETVLSRALTNYQQQIIDLALQDPNWREQFRTMMVSKGLTLLDVVARAGHISLYSYVSHIANNNYDRYKALKQAVTAGHGAFCRLLLNDGLAPWSMVEEEPCLEEIWSAQYPTKISPFADFPHYRQLIQQKKEIQLYLQEQLHMRQMIFFKSIDPLVELWLDHLKSTAPNQVEIIVASWSLTHKNHPRGKILLKAIDAIMDKYCPELTARGFGKRKNS